MLPKKRPPTRPGEVLLEEFLKPMGLSQVELARRMGVPVQRVNTIVSGRRDVTPDTAILLSRVLGTSPQFWMGLQVNLDLWTAEQKLSERLAGIGRQTAAVLAVSTAKPRRKAG